MKHMPSLLAPAGGMRTLETALRFGADAVYLGAPQYGLRAQAQNFDEAQLARALDLARKLAQSAGDKIVGQRFSFVFFVVVHGHADDTGAVLRQKNARHAGNIAPLLQKLPDAAGRGLGDLAGSSVDDVGDGGRAEAKLFGNVADAHARLIHGAPFLSQLHGVYS